ncbi:hypothetical protein KIN20_017719 [Parelaphostrongylus tenuis]|uniref:Uncharacterized protein n=1 Tax=Parelaphostrongylus tenuis TaxID=148309 RepID=A0AAD5MIX1_PARTN|nr:hypothetical protein KIN20_017717 [Parelaphostrongylus tenuis]KAJ1359090.1 hypothetical protein KIN20_017719 [Parelaphostrongylus tenuis]
MTRPYQRGVATGGPGEGYISGNVTMIANLRLAVGALQQLPLPVVEKEAKDSGKERVDAIAMCFVIKSKKSRNRPFVVAG